MPTSRIPARGQRLTGRLRAAALTGLVAVGLAATGPAAPAHAASTAELERRGVTQVIVKRQPDLTAAERADVRADAGVELVRRLTLPRTEVVSVEPGGLGRALAALERDPDVVYAEPDVIVTAAADPHWVDQWALENTGQAIGGIAGSAGADVKASEAWKTTTGAGQTVAIIDSGVEMSHPDLSGQMAVNPLESGAKASNGIDDDGNGFVDDFRGWDWVGLEHAPDATGKVAPPEGSDNDPSDVAGHGTHVAGIVAAKRDNGIGVAGIAPNARVLPLRVLDSRNSGLLSDAVEALHYAGRAGVRIANASLGIPASRATAADTGSLRDAMIANPRTLYVFAAGNASTGERFYPCALEEANVLCVGASNNLDQPAGFSNYGADWVDLYAPGQHIRSTYKGGYAAMNGTSMAAPLVAGTVALTATAHPSLTVTGLKARALDGVDRKSAFARSVTGGRLNAATTVAPAKAMTPAPTATPTPTPTATPTPAATPTATPTPAPIAQNPPPAQTTPPAPTKPLPVAQVTAPAPESPAPAPAAPSAPAPAATAPAALTPAPSLSGLALSSRALRKSLKVSFRVDRAASVRMMVSRKVCRGGRCTYRTARSWTTAASPGVNSQILRRSAGGRKLAAGSYKLTVQAVDGTRKSAVRSVSFSVR